MSGVCKLQNDGDAERPAVSHRGGPCHGKADWCRAEASGVMTRPEDLRMNRGVMDWPEVSCRDQRRHGQARGVMRPAVASRGRQRRDVDRVSGVRACVQIDNA